MAGLLGFALLLVAGVIAACDRCPAAFWGPGQGQELVTGRYHCVGTTYTDGRSSDAVPAELAVMAQICDAHVDLVISKVPAICTRDHARETA